jgi:hypothetical protein
MIKVPYNALLHSTDNINEFKSKANNASPLLNQVSFLQSKTDEFINSWSSLVREKMFDLQTNEAIINSILNKKKE